MLYNLNRTEAPFSKFIPFLISVGSLPHKAPVDKRKAPLSYHAPWCFKSEEPWKLVQNHEKTGRFLEISPGNDPIEPSSREESELIFSNGQGSVFWQDPAQKLRPL